MRLFDQVKEKWSISVVSNCCKLPSSDTFHWQTTRCLKSFPSWMCVSGVFVLCGLCRTKPQSRSRFHLQAACSRSSSFTALEKRAHSSFTLRSGRFLCFSCTFDVCSEKKNDHPAGLVRHFLTSQREHAYAMWKQMSDVPNSFMQISWRAGATRRLQQRDYKEDSFLSATNL